MKRKSVSWIVWAFLFLCLLGIVTSSYATYHHYKVDDGPSFCSVNATFNCDLVNKSTYSELFGVPVAIIGLFGYLALGYAVVVLSGLASDVFGLGRYWKNILLLGLVLGNGFSLYLTYIEAFVLKVYCPICLTSQSLMILLLVFGIVLYRKN